MKENAGPELTGGQSSWDQHGGNALPSLFYIADQGIPLANQGIQLANPIRPPQLCKLNHGVNPGHAGVTLGLVPPLI